MILVKTYKTHRMVFAGLNSPTQVLLRKDFEGLGPQLGAGLAVRPLIGPVSRGVAYHAEGMAQHQRL